MVPVSFGMYVEGSVAILLMVTIGYCAVLNQRLKRLHADRDTLRQMVTDLVQATDLANGAVSELKDAAEEADQVLNARLEAAEAFGIELANHVAAGQSVMDRIGKLMEKAQVRVPTPARPDERNKVQTALNQLASRPRMRGDAA